MTHPSILESNVEYIAQIDGAFIGLDSFDWRYQPPPHFHPTNSLRITWSVLITNSVSIDIYGNVEIVKWLRYFTIIYLIKLKM